MDELGHCALASFGHRSNGHLGTRPSTLEPELGRARAMASAVAEQSHAGGT
jgi:hypothetical protein